MLHPTHLQTSCNLHRHGIDLYISHGGPVQKPNPNKDSSWNSENNTQHDETTSPRCTEWIRMGDDFTFATLLFQAAPQFRNAPHGIQGESSCRMKGSAPWLSNTSTGWSDWHWTAWLSQLTRHPKYAPELSELGLEHAKYGQIYSFGIVWCSLLTDNPPVCRDVPYLYWCIKDPRIFHDHGRTKSYQISTRTWTIQNSKRPSCKDTPAWSSPTLFLELGPLNRIDAWEFLFQTIPPI